jgi:alanine transaminase
MVEQLYNKDAVERARTLLKAFGGAVGAYSHSKGALAVRKSVAKFIEGEKYVAFLL